MTAELALNELLREYPLPLRLQHLAQAIRTRFACGAVGLLKAEGESLQPIAIDGLAHETLGRRFEIAHHPRLALILSSRAPVHFPPGDPRPDPYDGLLDNHLGEALPVHDCLGISLFLHDTLWGALTLDAASGVFAAETIAALPHLARLAETLIRVSWLEEENARLRAAHLAQQGATPLARHEAEEEIVGLSPPLRETLNEIDLVAASELPVLLLGETGVGKELFARRLHRKSRRTDGALIYVNCAALPESLAESELFGHVKGAFSGAVGERAGRIEAADGGTLFLDEVGELPLSVQAKLLRTLQNGEIQRLGADQPHRIDVRIVAATNRALPQRIREGHFRADLYHRLSVYPVQIPPLRERGNDVLLLAGRFLEINRTRLGIRGLRLSPRAEAALCAYAWPGNVRELEHAIGRAALRALGRQEAQEGLVTLDTEHLDLDLQPPEMPSSAASEAAENRPESGDVPLKSAVDAYQRQLIRSALERQAGNWANAARALGIDASNLHKLARRLGLKA